MIVKYQPNVEKNDPQQSMWDGIQKYQPTPFELDNIVCHSVILLRISVPHRREQ